MIFGYKDLQVQMYYTAAKLNTYMGMTYKDKVTPEKDDGLTVSIALKLNVLTLYMFRLFVFGENWGYSHSLCVVFVVIVLLNL